MGALLVKVDDTDCRSIGLPCRDAVGLDGTGLSKLLYYIPRPATSLRVRSVSYCPGSVDRFSERPCGWLMAWWLLAVGCYRASQVDQPYDCNVDSGMFVGTLQSPYQTVGSPAMDHRNVIAGPGQQPGERAGRLDGVCQRWHCSRILRVRLSHVVRTKEREEAKVQGELGPPSDVKEGGGL
jgi:hypothetical protein